MTDRCQTVLVQSMDRGHVAAPLGAMESLATLGVLAGLPREVGYPLWISPMRGLEGQTC